MANYITRDFTNYKFTKRVAKRHPCIDRGWVAFGELVKIRHKEFFLVRNMNPNDPEYKCKR